MTDKVKVKGQIMWAQNIAAEPNDDGKYCFDLAHLSDRATEALTGMGIDVRNREDKGNFVTIRSKYPYRAFESSGEEIDLTNIKLANGTEAVVLCSPYEWTYGKKAGVSTRADRIVITKLIEYVAEGGATADEPDEVL